MEYLQSLQANLEADVQVWKDRAAKLKEENEQLLRKEKTQPKNAAPKKKQSLTTKQKKRQSKTTARTKKATTTPAKRKSTTASKVTTCDGKRTKTSSGNSTLSKKDSATQNDGKPSVSQKNGDSRKISKENSAAADKTAAAAFEIASSSDDDSSAMQPTSHVEAPIEEEAPIDDSMFELLSSSDEEKVESTVKGNVPAETEMEWLEEVSSLKNHEQESRARKDRSETFCLLQMAYFSFQKLGIKLVDTEDSSKARKESSNDLNGENEESSSVESAQDTTFFNLKGKPRKANFIPRSDEDVVIDILQAIKNLTRLYEQQQQQQTDHDDSEQEYLPIDKKSLAPCCNIIEMGDNYDSTRPLHPMVEGKQILFRALVLVDTFCSSFWSNEEWDSYFVESITDGAFYTEEMRVGLRGRKALVEKLIRSWDLELTSLWAQQDRAKRHTATVLHFVGGEIIASSNSEGAELIGGRKSLHWLSNVAERCISAQYVVSFYVARKDFANASRVVMNYILSAIPSFGVETYPKLPPVLSLCVLESMLWLDRGLFFGDRSQKESWFIKTLGDGMTQDTGSEGFVLQALSLVCRGLATIWRARMASTHDRIHDIALVEYKCFERIFVRLPFHGPNGAVEMNVDDITKECAKFVKGLLGTISKEDGSEDEILGIRWALKITLLLRGDKVDVEDLLQSALDKANEANCTDGRLHSFAEVIKQMFIRQQESLRDEVGKSPSLAYVIPNVSKRCKSIVGNATKASSLECRIKQLTEAMESAANLGDGTSVLLFVKSLLLESNQMKSTMDVSQGLTRRLLDSFRYCSELPVVRIINLERRKDRMNAFIAQALRFGMITLKALGNIEDNDNAHGQAPEGYEFGCYAFDGSGGMAEALARLTKVAGSASSLNSLVAPDWRPHDLKAFDREAPYHDNLVLMTASERACALSHICSWKAALRSMTLHSPKDSLQTTLFRDPSNLERLFKIAGFAEGPALLHQNDNMPPAPVCLIMEDDAILVDGFVDRLREVLRELPRDFHFCSLGYSRPRSAPVVPCSSHVGIPSMLWYLTGYLVSPGGAKYLLDSLPVVGPVDSWIGLKMSSNWDNVYGTRMGVGAHARAPAEEIPSKRELAKMLKFRAYCSLRPLCSQRVGSAVEAPSTGRTWRQRDTDIEYSGVLGIVQKR